MKEATLFTSTKISDSVTRISGITGELMYLVKGKERAALLDTGIGAGNIKGYAEGLTSLPLVVFLTHGHMDHAGGAFLFEDVYLHRKDWELFKANCTLDKRREYVQMTAGENAALVNDQDYVKDADKQFLNLDYGDCFDLGGITLEILDGTEHSQGSVCILIKEERAILLGDFCNQFTFMFLEESSTIEDYVEILLNVKKREGDFDKVYVSHGQGDAPKSVLDEVIIETCRDILEGKSEDVEYQFMDFTAYIAHNIAGIGEREDGKFGNVVYHKEKVYKNTQNVTSVQFFLKEK